MAEIQQTLEKLTAQASASARFNKILLGGFVAAGVAIIALLIQLGRG